MAAEIHHLDRILSAPSGKDGTPKPGKRGRKPPPPNESARDRFVRIGNRRMANALNSISLIGNLAAPNYAWTPEDLEAMSTALFEQIEKTFARFEVRKRPERPKFKLK